MKVIAIFDFYDHIIFINKKLFNHQTLLYNHFSQIIQIDQQSRNDGLLGKPAIKITVGTVIMLSMLSTHLHVNLFQILPGTFEIIADEKRLYRHNTITQMLATE